MVGRGMLAGLGGCLGSDVQLNEEIDLRPQEFSISTFASSSVQAMFDSDCSKHRTQCSLETPTT